MTICALLVTLWWCTTASLADGPPEVPKPTHAQVAAAVEETGDPELAELTATNEDYILRRIDRIPLVRHQLFEGTITQTSHPIYFYLAVDRQTQQVLIVSGRPASVRQILLTEPELATHAEVVPYVLELLAHVPYTHRLVRSGQELSGQLDEDIIQRIPAPRSTHSHDGWTFDFAAIDDIGRLQHWHVDLPRDGTPVVTHDTLATGLEAAY